MNNPIALPANVSHSFYVMVTNGILIYTYGYDDLENNFQQGDFVSEDDNLKSFARVGKSIIRDSFDSSTYGGTTSSRDFNGRIHYAIAEPSLAGTDTSSHPRAYSQTDSRTITHANGA
jgi:hypothetical protein